jgi:hypothetical protein
VTIEAPKHKGQLEDRIRNIARASGRAENQVARLIANVIVGQMLPAGVIKGGTAIKVRVGDAQTRFSRDLDTTRPAGVDLDDHLDELATRADGGWHGFRGSVRAERLPKAPPTVPDQYVMRPFKVALSYKGSSWVTIDLEIGHDEVGSTVDPEVRISPDVVELFRSLGLPDPDPIPMLPVAHQIAQKVHACTWDGGAQGNARAHDLVDLQIIVREERPDLAEAGQVAARLFASRRAQAWKPVVVVHPSDDPKKDWSLLYAAAAEGLDVLPTVEEAVRWANEDLIARM